MSAEKKRIMCVFGTRPELLKYATCIRDEETTIIRGCSLCYSTTPSDVGSGSLIRLGWFLIMIEYYER